MVDRRMTLQYNEPNELERRNKEMWKTQLCLGTGRDFGIPVEEQIRLFKKTGFEAFFTNWTDAEEVRHCRRLADELGMVYQSLHAPFGHADAMWEEGEATLPVIEELKECLRACAENQIPILVVHTIIGFDKHTPNLVGVKNYRQVVLEAQKLGVKVAFENTEGEEYLDMLMTYLGDSESVGFCWDTGHEMCYNYSKDMLSLYGNKLLCTHLNDNLGIKDYGGTITYIDDLHLLPFDGVADWEDVVRRLNRHGYQGILTFELTPVSKPGRHENDQYGKMTVEEYVTEIYKRACRVAVLKQKIR